MRARTIFAGLTITSVTAALLIGPAGGASAAEWSVLSVDPVEPGVADVCWTPYLPDTGEVTEYQLTIKPGPSAPVVLPTTSPPGADGYCVTDIEVKTTQLYEFSLQAKIDGATVVPATAAPLVAKAYALTAKISSPAVTVGKRVTVSGLLTDKRGVPVGGATVILLRKLAPSEVWTEVGTVTTADNGSYSYSFRARQNAKVRTYFQGLPDGPATVGAWNAGVSVDVSPVFSLTFNKRRATKGEPIKALGDVVRGNLEFLAGDPACLQVKEGGSWRSLACRDIGPEGDVRYRFEPTTRKDLKYRWWASSVAPEYVAGGSNVVTLTVR